MNPARPTLWIALALSGLLLGTPRAQALHAQETSPSTSTHDSTAATGAVPVVNSALNAELFYSILVSESLFNLARQGEQTRDAFVLMLDAAQRSKDERLFERAVMMALQARSAEAALQAVRAWKSALPLDRNANHFHIELLVSLNRAQEALPLLQQELQRSSPTERNALLARVPGGFAAAADKEKLLPGFDKLLAPYLADPVTAQAASLVLARMRLEAGQKESAWQAVQQAHVAAPQSNQPVLLALELWGSGFAPSQSLITQWLQTHADDHRMRFSYGRALLRREQFKPALEQFRQVAQAQPEWAAAHLAQGTLEAEFGDAQQAQTSLLRYVELAPSLSEGERQRGLTQVYQVLAGMAVRRQQPEEALKWLDRSPVGSDPMPLLLHKASILQSMGQTQQALSALEPQADDGPELQRRKVLAQTQLLQDNGQQQQAFELLGSWHAKIDGDVELLYQQAMLAEKLGQLDVMEKLLREHMQLSPQSHEAYNALGYTLAQNNTRLPEARQLIEKALSLVPGDAYVTDSLGWVEFRMGNLGKARELLEKAFASKPDAEIAAHLAEVYWAMGLQDKARLTAREALQIAPENETLLETLQRLKLGITPPANKRP